MQYHHETHLGIVLDGQGGSRGKAGLEVLGTVIGPIPTIHNLSGEVTPHTFLISSFKCVHLSIYGHLGATPPSKGGDQGQGGYGDDRQPWLQQRPKSSNVKVMIGSGGGGGGGGGDGIMLSIIPSLIVKEALLV